MDDSTNLEWLSTAIEQAAKSAKFCVVGCLPDVDPGIEVEGMGAIRFPLKRATAQELISRCRVAPYGKGTQTLVNEKVRSTFELDPKKFRLSDAWNTAIAHVLQSVAKELGLPAEQLEARLYKLLVYEKGGFFLAHRDSEKHDRMVASMIVVLPNRFEGGELVVRHGAAKQTLTFEEAARGAAPCYAAFYADCAHEVQRVTRGIRLCLAYNLVLKPKRAKRSTAAALAAPSDELAQSIGSWVATYPAKPLVFALEHHYTQRGLSLELLKGADRQLAEQVVAAAAKMDCLVHLTQVSRHLMQFADDGSFAQGYSRHYRPIRGAIQIGETYEDELSGTQWTDIRGRKQPWGEIAFDLSAIVASVPIDDWKPTSEEFEGYTGNAGNTLDRWYHRSAIVIWQREHHFEVVASSGATNSIPLFCSMTAKLTKTPRKKLEEARNDCIRFARAIIGGWPRHTFGYWDTVTQVKSPYDDFPEQLLTLHDRDTIALFLTKLAECDPAQRLSSFVVAACREFGWGAFDQELKQLILARPTMRGQRDIPFRDIEWLRGFCCDKTVDPEKAALAQELCALAVEGFCEPRPPQPRYYSREAHREVSVSEMSLPSLVTALMAGGCEDGLTQVIHFVQESPHQFGMEDCQVPCLKSVIPWARKQLGLVPPQLVSWLVAVRQQLESATARKPQPPTDWARPANVACNCQYCAQLQSFLADPANDVGHIPAPEHMRQHLIGMIQQHQCDVKHVLKRTGRPYSLMLTKTSGSFEREVKRYETNRRLLSALPLAE